MCAHTHTHIHSVYKCLSKIVCVWFWESTVIGVGTWRQRVRLSSVRRIGLTVLHPFYTQSLVHTHTHTYSTHVHHFEDTRD